MSRELNLGVFDPTDEKSLAQKTESTMVARRLEESGLLGEVVDQVKQIKGALKSLEMRNTQSESRISSLFSTALNLSERQQKQAQSLDASLKTLLESMNQKISNLASRVLKRNAQETQVQALLDRHNETVATMEARMDKLQKRVAQQEMQLLSYKSIVNELIDRTNR